MMSGMGIGLWERIKRNFRDFGKYYIFFLEGERK